MTVDLTDAGSDKAQCVVTNGDSIEPSQHIVSLFSSIVCTSNTALKMNIDFYMHISNE